MKKQLTILVCSSDGYSDLWLPFFTLLDKYWKNIDYKIILNTESKKFNYSNLDIKTINDSNLKDLSYGQRMKLHLNHIDTKFTLLLLDDFFIRKEVNEQVIKKILLWLENDSNIACFSFDQNDEVIYDNKYEGFAKIKKFAPYKLNMQAGIWRTDVLLKYWHDDDDPWIWELFTNYLTFNDSLDYYSSIDRDLSPIFYGYNPKGMGVFRGKWVKSDVETLFRENDIYIDWSQRGIYDENKSKKIINNYLYTLIILKRRLTVQMFFSFIWFYLKKKILEVFKIKYQYKNHNELLQKKYERKTNKDVR